jgi:hypothetical protein
VAAGVGDSATAAGAEAIVDVVDVVVDVVVVDSVVRVWTGMQTVACDLCVQWFLHQMQRGPAGEACEAVAQDSTDVGIRPR